MKRLTFTLVALTVCFAGCFDNSPPPIEFSFRGLKLDEAFDPSRFPRKDEFEEVAESEYRFYRDEFSHPRISRFSQPLFGRIEINSDLDICDWKVATIDGRIAMIEFELHDLPFRAVHVFSEKFGKPHERTEGTLSFKQVLWETESGVPFTIRNKGSYALARIRTREYIALQQAEDQEKERRWDEDRRARMNETLNNL